MCVVVMSWRHMVCRWRHYCYIHGVCLSAVHPHVMARSHRLTLQHAAYHMNACEFFEKKNFICRKKRVEKVVVVYMTEWAVCIVIGCCTVIAEWPRQREITGAHRHMKKGSAQIFLFLHVKQTFFRVPRWAKPAEITYRTQKHRPTDRPARYAPEEWPKIYSWNYSLCHIVVTYDTL